MEVTRNDLPLSEQVDYKKMNSDWDVFNHQQDYNFKSQNKFFSNVTKIAKHVRVMQNIANLQKQLQKYK